MSERGGELDLDVMGEGDNGDDSDTGDMGELHGVSVDIRHRTCDE